MRLLPPISFFQRIAMDYLVESSKSFQEAVFDLEPVVQRLGFVILHRHPLVSMLGEKDLGFDDECCIFDICNYRLTEKLLAIDMRLALVLPWRIAVFTENGATKIGLLSAARLSAAICRDIRLAPLALEMEEKLTQIVDEVR
jgi:uncharacterized protein (DUF302 family)